MLGLYSISDIYNGFYPIFLTLITILAVTAGIFIIIMKNPITSVLFLILLFSTIACHLIFAGIKFIGISYLLVYVGAVSILFLFILMLINIRVSELIGDTNNNMPLGALTILAFFVPFNEILPSPDTKTTESKSLLHNFTQENIFYVSSKNWDSNIIDFSDIMSIGNIMYTSYSIWLLLTSIILLLAMVGSIVITIKQKY